MDQTSGDHWSKISVILKMESADQISIEVFIALHELARDQLGLQQIDLGGIRTNKMEYWPITSGTSSMNKQAMATVSERMFSQDEMVMNVLGKTSNQ